MRIHTPLFHIHPDIAAIVYSAVGQACSIVVHRLCRYSMCGSAKMQYRAYYSERYCITVGHYIAGGAAWKNASGVLESPGKAQEFFCNQIEWNPV